ncbi:MAG: hypothetical protein DSZ10_02345 [Sulfurovum sp.]|nr:MAG: hypothetical protein DSZ10_02345 [Sulfurovum sp.]
MIKQMIKTSLLAGSALLLMSGCGSDNKANSNDAVGGHNEQGALSIVYESTSADPASGKMIAHYHVHAVDENGNAISGLPLKVSLVNGARELRGQKVQHDTGTILSTKPISFHDDGIDFSQTDVRKGDTLIVIPSSGKTGKDYLGDWTIVEKGHDLGLRERSYGLESTNGLTYIIGNEQRWLSGRISAVAHVQGRGRNDTNSTSSSNHGFTYFDIVFDPVLAGHTATVGVHTEGNRMGGAKVITLRGGEFVAPDVKIPVTGKTEYATMRILIDPGDGMGTENLIDVELVPTSFTVEPLSNCRINYRLSDFRTDHNGEVTIAVDTFKSADSNSSKETSSSECTLKWNASAGSIYYEY